MKNLIILLSLSSFLFLSPSCKEKSQKEKMNDAIEQAKEDVEDAAENAKDGIDDMVEEVEEELE